MGGEREKEASVSASSVRGLRKRRRTSQQSPCPSPSVTEFLGRFGLYLRNTRVLVLPKRATTARALPEHSMAPPAARRPRARLPSGLSIRQPTRLASSLSKPRSKGTKKAMCRRMMVRPRVQTNNQPSRISSVTVHGSLYVSEGAKKTSIDELPEDILSHIHSLLPLQDAARTACVSHRFLRSWRCFPNLTFGLEALGLFEHPYEGRAKNLVDRVQHILQNHSGIGVKTLKLKLCGCDSGITAYHLNSWLQLIVKPGIVELAVHLPRCKDLEYNFSSSLFSDETTSSLQSLSLLSCGFHLASRNGCWRSLLSVCLHSVRITEEVLGCFLSSTLALEKLSLSSCNEIAILKIPSLLQQLSFLEVSLCRMVQMIDSDAPMLSTFIYVGPPIKISFGVSSLVKKIKVNSSLYSGMVQFARTRLPSIASNLQALTLSSYGEAFNTPMIPDKFLHLKYLNICLCGRDTFRGYDFFSLVSFLEACPALECFGLCAGEHTKLRRDSILGDSSGEMRRVPGFRQDNLKAVCITGFCSAKSLVELTCQILENTPSLQDMILDTTLGFHDEFFELGKCHIMCNEALTEANNAVEALRVYVEGKVPSSVRFKVWEPCKRCHAGKSKRP